jgi:hypothetical protein
MGVSIIEYPKADVNGNPYTVSKWNALHHPIVFQYQRKDRAVQSSAFFDSSTIQVQVDGTIEGAVGDSVYINSGLNEGMATIQSIIYSGTTSIIRLDYVALTTTTQLGGFLNFNSYRRNYNTITNILAVNSFGAYYVLGRSINKPDHTGLIKVDVSTYLKALVDYFDTFQYNAINWRDNSLGGRFNITYSENWTGTDGAFSAVSGTALYYFVNSTKQIQQVYGSNVGENVTFANTVGSPTYAKFLSDFEVPTYFQGFPFSLGFIYSENIAGMPVQKKETVLDVNKSAGATSTNALSATQSLGVNRLKVDEGYASTIKYLDVWLEGNPSSSIALPWVAAGYVATGYVAVATAVPAVTVVPEIITGEVR